MSHIFTVKTSNKLSIKCEFTVYYEKCILMLVVILLIWKNFKLITAVFCNFIKVSSKNILNSTFIIFKLFKNIIFIEFEFLKLCGYVLIIYLTSLFFPTAQYFYQQEFYFPFPSCNSCIVNFDFLSFAFQ